MSIGAQYRGGNIHYFDKTTHERALLAAPVVLKDDFLGAATVIPAAGSPESGVQWVKKIVGAAPPTVAIKADATNGILECALTSTSEKQNAECYMNDELQFSMLQGLVFEARIAPTVLPTGNAEMVIGLISNWADGLDAATYSAFFTLDGSGEIICESDDNATDSSATSGVTLTNTDSAIVRLEMLPGASAISFFVNGNQVATSTSFAWAASAANSKVQPVVGCYKASGTGVGTLECDYVLVAQNRS